eukprot:CAMPEP_0179437350 /NCGR_PEP_ID=MMETSP0799-20121207/21258_1 /TAXON_ID=46947 /ORGANISM="Geminigera cryophila, Strain CCMP2564" /LENGTH=75 /DNA_ID=CAMNT_0021218229 /DNA_START=14 /DNA_END=241 /DNA_ORIENTATION=-
MLVKILKMHSLEDAPWTWKSNWNKGMPEFFQDMPSGVTDNIYEDLDDSPVTWKINEPVDPTRYQDGYIGNVIGIY